LGVLVPAGGAAAARSADADGDDAAARTSGRARAYVALQLLEAVLGVAGALLGACGGPLRALAAAGVLRGRLGLVGGDALVLVG